MEINGFLFLVECPRLKRGAFSLYPMRNSDEMTIGKAHGAPRTPLYFRDGLTGTFSSNSDFDSVEIITDLKIEFKSR